MAVKYATVSSVRLCGKRLPERQSDHVVPSWRMLFVATADTDTHVKPSFVRYAPCLSVAGGGAHVNHFRTKRANAANLHGMSRSCFICFLNPRCLFAIVSTCGEANVLQSCGFFACGQRFERLPCVMTSKARPFAYTMRPRVGRDRRTTKHCARGVRTWGILRYKFLQRAGWSTAVCRRRHTVFLMRGRGHHLSLDQVVWLDFAMSYRGQHFSNRQSGSHAMLSYIESFGRGLRACCVRAERCFLFFFCMFHPEAVARRRP